MEITVRLNKPHKGQALFLSNRSRFRVLMCGRRWGKSDISKNLAVETILNSKLVAYVTPNYALGKVFYDDILQILPKELITSTNKTDLVIKTITGGVLSFFTGEKPDSFRGLKFHLVIIDEAAYVKDLKEAWQNAIRPTLTDYKGSAVFISTPRGQGFFHNLFLKGKDVMEEDWSSFHFTSYDNPYIDDREIDEAKLDLPESAFRQEYLAEPSENIANPFGTNNIKKNIVKGLSKKPSVVYGIDLAKTYDYTVIIGLDEDGCMSHYERFQKDWLQTKERIKALPRSVKKHIDSTGVGDVIVEELRSEIPNIIGFKFTAQSKPQLIMSLIKAIEMGDVKYIDDVVDELMVFEYKISTSGAIKYEAQSSFHDDKVISLALANFIRIKGQRINSTWNIGTA